MRSDGCQLTGISRPHLALPNIPCRGSFHFGERRCEGSASVSSFEAAAGSGRRAWDERKMLSMRGNPVVADLGRG
jgi:hypothetical protein